MFRTTIAAAASATLLAAGVACLAGGAAGTADASSGSAQSHLHPRHGAGRTYVVHDIRGNLAMADLAEPHGQEPDIGDELAFTQRLTRGGQTVGRISSVSLGVDHDRALFQSNGTMRLRRGDVTFAGLVAQSSHFVLAVTGGTGRYRGAAGTLAFDFAKRPTVTVHLTH